MGAKVDTISGVYRFFNLADLVSKLGGAFVFLRGYRLFHLPPQPDELRPVLAPGRVPLGGLSNVLGFAVDAEDQGL